MCLEYACNTWFLTIFFFFQNLKDLPSTNNVIVYRSWIEDCLRQGKLVDCDAYLVAK